MQLIPVVDLLAGRAVRAIGSRPRGEYPPLHSALAGGAADLTSLAHGLRQLEPLAVYVADLDAIEGRPGNAAAIETLCAAGLKVWLDAGCRGREDLERSLGPTAASIEVIAGLESLPNPAALADLLKILGPAQLVFSLDLRDGRPLGNAAGWGERTALEIAQLALDFRVARMIVLDLASVGRGDGPHTLPLCRELRRLAPNLELISGGGVRGEQDLGAFALAGCSAVLIGAALHAGRLAPGDVLRWNQRADREPAPSGQRSQARLS